MHYWEAFALSALPTPEPRSQAEHETYHHRVLAQTANPGRPGRLGRRTTRRVSSCCVPQDKYWGAPMGVDRHGRISIARQAHKVGVTFAGELVEAVVSGGLVEICYRQVLSPTHVQRGQAASSSARVRIPATGPSTVRMTDTNGNVYFAGARHRTGREQAFHPITVTMVGGSVQLCVDGKVIRVHAACGDPVKEHGTFATPNGHPHRTKAV